MGHRQNSAVNGSGQGMRPFAAIETMAPSSASLLRSTPGDPHLLPLLAQLLRPHGAMRNLGF
jgi:hypothetical protein